ncbi:hypothetical protein BDV93DRAFT_560564 [Ceratobasidium sp. AG-I]|nr:hypothetical protein BDV93DRAFT_560564 [Ceratobasidium sp. AG-I]
MADIAVVKAADVANWCEDTHNGWFVQVNNRLQGITTLEGCAAVYGRAHFPNLLHTLPFSKVTHTQSTLSGSSAAHLGPAYTTTPLPPCSVAGSGAGLGHRPSQLSQLLLMILGNHSAPQVPSNVATKAEVLWDQRLFNNQVIDVLDAKEDWIRSEALVSRIDCVAQLAEMDAKTSSRQLEDAHKILRVPDLTAETQQPPETFVNMLMLLENNAGTAGSSVFPPWPSLPPLPLL